MTHSLVLLSGGMDSATALAVADDQKDTITALSVDYGQRHRRELAAARAVAEHYGVEHLVLDLTSWGALLSGTSLIDDSVPVPEGHYSAPSMVATIVPNRNATLLMAAVGIAISRDADKVVTAVHAGDHAIYPDCRPEFIDSINRTIALATETEVWVQAPFSHASKTDIARLGARLGVPYGLTWSCYRGGAVHCGRCGTCFERREAFAHAHLADPTEYES